MPLNKLTTIQVPNAHLRAITMSYDLKSKRPFETQEENK